jgi:hypothetical protein
MAVRARLLLRASLPVEQKAAGPEQGHEEPGDKDSAARPADIGRTANHQADAEEGKVRGPRPAPTGAGLQFCPIS